MHNRSYIGKIKKRSLNEFKIIIKVFGLFVLIVMFRLCKSKSASRDLATFGFIVCGNHIVVVQLFRTEPINWRVWIHSYNHR